MIYLCFAILALCEWLDALDEERRAKRQRGEVQP